MPVPNGYAQVRIPGSLNPAIYGIFTFGVDHTVAFTNPTDIAEAVWDVFAATLLGRSDSSYLWGPVQVTMGDPSGDIPGSGTSQAVGTRSDEMAPPNLAVLVRKVTAIGGRRGRGRMYLPFMASEDDVTEGGVLTTVARGDTQTECNDFLAGLATADLPMVLFHEDGGLPTDVTSLQVQQLTATQRRRLRR